MLSRLEISQSDFDELTAFIKEKYLSLIHI